MKVDIFYGNNVRSHEGKNRTIEWDNFVDKLIKPQIQKKISEQDLREMTWYSDYSKKELKELQKSNPEKWKDYQSNKKILAPMKSIGYVIGAKFQNNIRREDEIIHRSLMTFDIDNCGKKSIEEILNLFKKYEYTFYTTFSHLPERPKFRIIFPLSKTIDDKLTYENAVTNFVYRHGLKFENYEGIGEVDPVSKKYNQLMFLPNKTLDGAFKTGRNKGICLNLLDFYTSNDNITLEENQTNKLQESKIDNKILDKIKKVISPYDLEGDNNLIKEFCMKYDIHTTIKNWLEDVYKRESTNEYTYKLGSSTNGFKVYPDSKSRPNIFCYSFHSTDKLNDERIHNSFDLLKIQKFNGDMDKTVEFCKTILDWKQEEQEEIIPINPFQGLNTDNFYNQVEAYIKYERLNVGFERLDKHLNGVLPGLYILGADTGFGKSTLMLQMADNIASTGKKVLFYSLEMSNFEMTCKSLSRIAKQQLNENVSIRDIMYNTDNELTSNCINEYNKYSKNIEIIEGNFDLTMKKLNQSIDQHIEKMQDGQKPVIFIDYLQVLQPNDVRMTDKASLDYNIKALKKLSRELFVPIFLISSLNRSSYNQDLSNTAFKESGGIEYTADVLLGLQGKIVDELMEYPKATEAHATKRKEIWVKYKDETQRTGIVKTKLKCMKNRFGKKDFDVNFDFYPKNNYFEENSTDNKNDDNVVMFPDMPET